MARALLGDGAELQFADDVKVDEFRLLTLTDDIMATLRRGERLRIKVTAASSAVLCTEDHTYQLERVEISNAMLLAGPVGARAEPAVGGTLPTVPIVGLQTCVMEVRPIPPRLDDLMTFIQRDPITGADSDDEEEGEDGEGAQDEAADAEDAPALASSPGSPAAAAAAGGGSGGDSGDGGGDGSGGPRAPSVSPLVVQAEAEAAQAAKRTRFSLEELEALVGASSAELRAGLDSLGAVEVDGHWRVLAPAYEDTVVDALLEAIADNEWPLLAVPVDAATAYVGDQARDAVAHACLRRLGRPSADGKTVAVSIQRGARWRGRALLRALVAGGKGVSQVVPGDAYPTRVPLDDFMPAWEMAVEPLKHLPGPRRLPGPAGGGGGGDDAEPAGEAGGAAGGGAGSASEFDVDAWAPDLRQLAGEALPETVAGTPCVAYFPEGELPRDPAQRFRKLFARKAQWSPEDLGPYVAPLAGPGRSAVDLLLRYTRVTTMPNGDKVHSQR